MTTNDPIQFQSTFFERLADADRPFTHSAEDAYPLVLDRAGASRSRDAADERVIKAICTRTHRRIDSQEEVGGWPGLRNAPTPRDTDQDGMPDE